MSNLDPSQASTSQGAGNNGVRECVDLENMENYVKSGYDAIHEGVVSANSFPEGIERNHYRKQESFRKIVRNEGVRILEVMQLVVNALGKGKQLMECSDVDKSELIVDVNDTLLDRSSLNMDVLDGIRDEEVTHQVFRTVSGSWNRPKAPRTQTSVPTLHATKVNLRPQTHFKEKVDNSNTPWVPTLKEKPNSIKPLSILVECNDDGAECFSHPYEYELDRWSPSNDRLKLMKPIRHKPIEHTPLMYVETEDDLKTLLTELEGQAEIAVDLEHHSYRSFMGFTCLLQISTREKDYVVDALALRSDLHVLNEIFTKQSVLKVFHGAENDVEWLQRDLGLYVVNMFDTHQAAKLLDFQRLNLAHLLANYCGIDADKHFQLYDWRTRPLPDNVIMYAREDTHYLLYIYSRMSNELIDKAQGNTNLLESVFKRSTEVCKRRYMKPILEDDSHMLLYRKGKRLFDNRQLYALKELYRWRDRTAREMDESIGYILPTHMMMQIAENLPREVQGILACCNPIPPVVRQHLHELHYVILAARDQPLVKTIHESGTVTVDRRSQPSTITKWDGQEALRDDLPTLLGTGLPSPSSLIKVKPKTPFIYDEDDDEQENSKKIIRSLLEIENKKYVNAYQRYKLVLPYVNQMEKDQREKEEREYQECRRREKQMEAQKNEIILKQEVIKFEKPSSPLSKQAQKRKSTENGLSNLKQKADKCKPDGGKAPVRPDRKGILNLEINASESRPSSFGSNQGNEKPFVPFNYKNVDFNKFQSNSDMKISDSQTKKGKRKQQFGSKNFKNKRSR